MNVRTGRELPDPGRGNLAIVLVLIIVSGYLYVSFTERPTTPLSQGISWCDDADWGDPTSLR
jgi:hypothetical protein